MSALTPVRAGFVLRAGFTLGIGMGAFADVLLLHLLLGWHRTLLAVTPDVRANDAADGVILLSGWLVTLAGVVLLWRAARRPGARLEHKRLAGGFLAGWGLFNLADALLLHFALGLHHTRMIGSEPTLLWDIGYLALSVLLLVSGALLARRGASATRSRWLPGGPIS